MFMNRALMDRAEALLMEVESKVSIPAEHRAVALHRRHAIGLLAAMLHFRPQKTLEIGLGLGLSAACIQAAGSEDHTIVSLDFDEDRQRTGMQNAMAFGVPRVFLGPSDIGLPSLLEHERASFDLILIDGAHKFDDAFVDLHFALQLCRVQGVILIDDTWMPSIRTVCSWLERNHSNVATLEHYECLFMYQKRGADEREWTHWEPFDVAPAQRARAAAI